MSNVKMFKVGVRILADKDQPFKYHIESVLDDEGKWTEVVDKADYDKLKADYGKLINGDILAHESACFKGVIQELEAAKGLIEKLSNVLKLLDNREVWVSPVGECCNRECPFSNGKIGDIAGKALEELERWESGK